MKVRTVLYADEGTMLTNGKDFGTIIWLAEDVSPDSYHPIPVDEYEKIVAESEVVDE